MVHFFSSNKYTVLVFLTRLKKTFFSPQHRSLPDLLPLRGDPLRRPLHPRLRLRPEIRGRVRGEGGLVRKGLLLLHHRKQVAGDEVSLMLCCFCCCCCCSCCCCRCSGCCFHVLLYPPAVSAVCFPPVLQVLLTALNFIVTLTLLFEFCFE